MFKVYKTQCKNCLLSADAIVGPDRRKELIQEVTSQQGYFICHKASQRGEDVCCRKFYDQLGHTSQMIRTCGRMGWVEEVDQPDEERLVSWKERKKNNV